MPTRTEPSLTVRDNAWAVLLGAVVGFVIAMALLSADGRIALALGFLLGALFMFSIWMFDYAGSDTSGTDGAP